MQPNMIGAYGLWAASLTGDGPAALSFRNEKWVDVDTWRPVARQRLLDCLAQPYSGGAPEVTIHTETVVDGLCIEELSWQLPYGPPTKAIFLKPAHANGKLPAVLALHDHARNKYFGRQKITRTVDPLHPMMVDHQQHSYGGAAWANASSAFQ